MHRAGRVRGGGRRCLTRPRPQSRWSVCGTERHARELFEAAPDVVDQRALAAGVAEPADGAAELDQSGVADGLDQRGFQHRGLTADGSEGVDDPIWSGPGRVDDGHFRAGGGEVDGGIEVDPVGDQAIGLGIGPEPAGGIRDRTCSE